MKKKILKYLLIIALVVAALFFLTKGISLTLSLIDNSNTKILTALCVTMNLLLVVEVNKLKKSNHNLKLKCTSLNKNLGKLKRKQKIRG